MLEVAEIESGSTGAKAGILPREKIIAINGTLVNDVIDYAFLIADERVAVSIRSLKGRTRTIKLDKTPDDRLGLSFAPFSVKRCRNRCIFCFVDQMPPGCRNSLYIKDDDYRASFLYGNYITLGALNEPDWQRIFDQRLSPLYLSVHTTDPALRGFMLGNRRAPDIMLNIKRLADNGIRMHTQVVLCPGVNDGDHLRKTIEDLAGLFPAVASIAVVPVGMTAYRKGLYPLKSFTRLQAAQVVALLKRMGDRFRRRMGSRLVYASDEFYIKAGLPLPSLSFYEDLPQIENGVGMVADFLHDAGKVRCPAAVRNTGAIAVTGKSFGVLMKSLAAQLKRSCGIRLQVIVAQNKFFGETVTVSGLLTGRDIKAALAGKKNGGLAFIPANAVSEESGLFLDGMSIAELSRTTGKTIVPVSLLSEIPQLLLGQGRQ